MGQTVFARDLAGYGVVAGHGVVRWARDIYFDDRQWKVRYVVVALRHGLTIRQVLVSPVCVVGVDAAARRLETSLTREQILHGPDIDADRPVSRQHEIALHEYYGIPFYWMDEDPASRWGDPHLRSIRAIRGYTVIDRDAAVGHVTDFSIDVGAWTLVDVLVARHHWPGAPRVRLAVNAIERVSWMGKAIYLDARVTPPSRAA